MNEHLRPLRARVAVELDRLYIRHVPLIGGNHVELLVDGDQVYPAMLEAISSAARSIVLESYIFRPDVAGRRFLEALVERAQAGVSTRVLVDGVGASDTPRAFWQPLLDQGGRVEVFRPVRRFLRLGARLFQRDHRKLLVIDDHVGFIGGLNIGDDYAPASWGGAAWHDAHARLVGPAARALTVLFNRAWRQVTHENWSPELGPSVVSGPTSVQILEGRLTRRYSVRKAYLHAIRNATRTIRITNAYCIPDRPVRRALRGAKRRGTRVQMLLAGRTDMWPVQYAGRHLYKRLLSWGVEIFEWTEHVLHAKTAVIDGRWCSIGSYNLDRRSLLHNLEANIACVDGAVGAALDAQFEADLARSRRIDPESWHRRSAVDKLLEGFFYSLRYLL